MRLYITYIIVLCFILLDVSAQDRKDIEGRIGKITSQIDSLTSVRDGLTDQLNTIIREDALARIDDLNGVKVILRGNNGLYKEGAFSPDKMVKDVTGVLTGRFDNNKAYFIGENGGEGYVLMSKMEFLEDPKEFFAVFGTDIQGMAKGDWDKATEKWEVDSGVGYFPLAIEGFRFSVNSAGGVEPAIRIRNRTEKTIKYTTVELSPFNSVGDPAPDRFDKSFTLRLVGPIEEQGRSTFNYEGNPVIYNGVVSCIEVRRVIVEYMDGTSYTMVNDLAEARRATQDYKVRGECAY